MAIRNTKSSTKISKIQKTSAPELVCENMKSMIAQNIWEEGKKIPSENELAEAFGVNRFTIRMALQKLNTLGIVETRVGDGTYVCSFDLSKHMSEIYEFYMTDELLDDVAEYRNIIESACIRLALSRATSEDLDIFKTYCDEFDSMTRKFYASSSSARKSAFDSMNDIDIQLHEHICRMAHNDLLFYSFSTAKHVIREHMSTIGYRRLMSLSSADELQSLKEHYKIYELLCSKPSSAETKLKKIIASHVKR